MTTEATHNQSFLVAELPGSLSRDQITLASTGSLQNLTAGTVLGVITKPSIGGAPGGSNTGNATIGSLQIGTGGVPAAGVWVATCTDATHFSVVDPSGNASGTGTFGSAFSNGLVQFTITAGGTPCVSGDLFNITVGSNAGQLVPVNPTATDGSQYAAAILLDTTQVPINTPTHAAVLNFGASVSTSKLNWGSLSAPQIAVATAQLAALGIKQRVTN